MLQPRSLQPRRQGEQRRAAVADAEAAGSSTGPSGWERAGRAARPCPARPWRGARPASACPARGPRTRTPPCRRGRGARRARRRHAAPSMRGLRAADRDRDELAGPELGRDGGRDQRHRVIGVDPPQGQHGAPDLHWGHKRPAGRATGCIIWAACSCSDRTPTSPRMMASMPCTAAAKPGGRGDARDAAADRGGADLVAVQPRARIVPGCRTACSRSGRPRRRGSASTMVGSPSGPAAVAVLTHDRGTDPVAPQHLRRFPRWPRSRSPGRRGA